MPKTPARIPDRWEKYTPCGNQIGDSPFIAFKVPLKPYLLMKKFKQEAEFPLEFQWTPQVLIEKLPSLVMVIDLTNTHRYYDPSCFKFSKTNKKYGERKCRHRRINRHGDKEEALVCDTISGPENDNNTSCDRIKETSTSMSNLARSANSLYPRNPIKYIKIQTQGHAIPSTNVVERFFNAVDESLQTQRDGLIGVHCTHGVNRTGYLICRYLIERLQWTPEDALISFEKYRGYPIERLNYIEDLKKCSGKPIVNKPATRNSSKEVKDPSSFKRNEVKPKTEGPNKDQTTNQSVFYDDRTGNLSVNNDSEALSKIEKECITDHLMTSQLDLYSS